MYVVTILVYYSTLLYITCRQDLSFNLNTLKMSSKPKGRRLPMAARDSRQSKATIAVAVQNQNIDVRAGIQSLRDTAISLLASDNPTKRARKELLDTANTLLVLQSDVEQKIPDLVPSTCMKYAVNRLQSDSNQQRKTCDEVTPPRDNMRVRFFSVVGRLIKLPQNRVQYTCLEVCNILMQIEEEIKASEVNTRKGISLRKVIEAMRDYKVSPSSEALPLIPVTRSGMFRIFARFKDNGIASWPKMGRPPILNNQAFLDSVHEFEKDEGRAIGDKDMKGMLKAAKKDVAKAKGNSITIVETPTKRSLNNYIALLPQLDPSRSWTDTVQQKSEARYIAERSFRNAVSHIMTVAVSHYQLGKAEKRLPKLEKVTKGAKLLYDLISKENSGLELRVILPMFVSTTDDTTVFAFEGAVDGGEGERFIICKDNDTKTRSSYTKNTASTDSMRGIRIRHTVSFNALGNAAPFYATVYGLTTEELPVTTCPSGILPVLLTGFCYGGDQDVSNKTKGWLVFIRNTTKDDEISTDQKNHEHCRKNVFLPYVEETRAAYL